MPSSLYYPINAYILGTAPLLRQVTTTYVLPLSAALGDCVILIADANAGLQVWNGTAWQLSLAEIDLSTCAIFGYTIDVYVNPPTAPILSNSAQIYNSTAIVSNITAHTAAPTEIWIVTSANRQNYLVVDPGSAGALAVRFSGYENTGFYMAANGDMVFLITGSEIMRITATGIFVTGYVDATGPLQADTP